MTKRGMKPTGIAIFEAQVRATHRHFFSPVKQVDYAHISRKHARSFQNNHGTQTVTKDSRLMGTCGGLQEKGYASVAHYVQAQILARPGAAPPAPAARGDAAPESMRDLTNVVP